MEEIWKDVVGYEGLYQVSNLGRVKRVESRVRSCLKHLGGFKTVKEKIKTANVINKYYSVRLCKDNKPKTWKVHRLVAMAFCLTLTTYHK